MARQAPSGRPGVTGRTQTGTAGITTPRVTYTTVTRRASASDRWNVTGSGQHKVTLRRSESPHCYQPDGLLANGGATWVLSCSWRASPLGVQVGLGTKKGRSVWIALAGRPICALISAQAPHSEGGRDHPGTAHHRESARALLGGGHKAGGGGEIGVGWAKGLHVFHLIRTARTRVTQRVTVCKGYE
jgi:hypothetical protein